MHPDSDKCASEKEKDPRKNKKQCREKEFTIKFRNRKASEI